MQISRPFSARTSSGCVRSLNFRGLLASAALTAALTLGLAAPRALAAPPVLSDADVPTQVVVGNKVTFQITYKDPDGDVPQKLVCTVEGPGGTEKKEYTGVKGATAATGAIADFPMGPFALDGQYTVRFAATSADGEVQSPPQSFVVVNLTRRWYELAGGVAVALIVLPLLVFLLTRVIAPRSDPRSSARFGLMAGVAAAYIWYVMLFGALHQGVGIVVGAVVALAAIVALLSGNKKK